jgi:hypothetical protein
VVFYTDEALQDLHSIRSRDGSAIMLSLFQWCERLREPTTRSEAERLSASPELFRLRVGDHHITYILEESLEGDSVHIEHVRRRRT